MHAACVRCSKPADLCRSLTSFCGQKSFSPKIVPSLDLCQRWPAQAKQEIMGKEIVAAFNSTVPAATTDIQRSVINTLWERMNSDKSHELFDWKPCNRVGSLRRFGRFPPLSAAHFQSFAFCELHFPSQSTVIKGAMKFKLPDFLETTLKLLK